MLETLLARARQHDPTRLVTIVTLMGGPTSWMEQCDVICMNRYWGWYVLGGELDKAQAALEQELDSVWEQWHKPIIMTEFGADTMAGMHGHPDVMWTEEYQADYIRRHLEVAGRKEYVAGMQVWNFADFAAVQSIMRVGGLNMKGVFTRTRTPKMAAHVLREFWVKK
jgi:beta-glucuronidase